MTARDGVVSSSATGVAGATIAGLSLEGTTYTNAPGGLVGWTFSNPDYASQTGNATVTIDQAGSTVTVTPASSSVTYDVQQHGATATWASTGTDDEGGSLTVTYAGIDGTDYASSTRPPRKSASTRPGQLRGQRGPHGEQQHGRLRHHPGHGHDHGHRLQRHVSTARRTAWSAVRPRAWAARRSRASP